MGKNNVSIKKIAELSGVSVATVSRVINDNGRFSEDTRKKVLKVIEDTNYQMNTVAKSLRMNKSHTIGILVPDISNSFFSSVVQELEFILFEAGYATIICNTARNQEKEEAYIKMLTSKMVDGLIVISGFSTFDTKDITNDIPVICIDRKPNNQRNSVVVESDHYLGGYLAAKELVDKGTRNNAIIIHRGFLSSSKDRLAGFKAALAEANLPFNQNHIIDLGNETVPSRRDLAKNLLLEKLKNGNKIDGVFAINDRLAIGAIEAAKEFNLKIPTEIKIVGFDNDLMSEYYQPSLSTIKHDIPLLVKTASNYLLTMLANKSVYETGIHKIIPVEIIKRETT